MKFPFLRSRPPSSTLASSFFSSPPPVVVPRVPCVVDGKLFFAQVIAPIHHLRARARAQHLSRKLLVSGTNEKNNPVNIAGELITPAKFLRLPVSFAIQSSRLLRGRALSRGSMLPCASYPRVRNAPRMGGEGRNGGMGKRTRSFLI